MLIKSRKIAIMNLFMDKMLKNFQFVNFQVTLKVMGNYNEMVTKNKQKKSPYLSSLMLIFLLCVELKMNTERRNEFKTF